MRKYKKLECNNEEYAAIQNVQFQNKNFVTEQHIGSRKKLFSNNQMIATVSIYNSLELGGITKTQFNSFLGTFNKQLYKQFSKDPNLHNLHIDFKGLSRDKNFDEWDKLKDGDYFYNLDLRSAYWQIAHKLGYLNDKMFKTYIQADEYKMAKRVCISFLARKNYMVYHPLVGDSFKITCDTTALTNVYKNIRHYLYNTMTKCVEDDISWLEYNIDGVTVTAEHLLKVQQYFTYLDLKYKITECRKVNDREYLYGSKQRKFKNR